MTQEFQIAKFGVRNEAVERYPEVKAWLLNSKANGETSVKLWTEPDYLQTLQALYPQLSDTIFTARKGGFAKGRPLIETETTIKTCGIGGPRRPKYLYRVVHDETPFGGTKARGHGLVNSLDPIRFQNYFQKHRNWNCRFPSPFMSVTDSYTLVAVIAAFHKVRGKTSIRVLTIDTTGPHWDHEKRRIWNANHLGEQFGTGASIYGNEYLIEDSIPPKSVIGEWKWEGSGGMRMWLDQYEKHEDRQWRKFTAYQSRKRSLAAKRTFDEMTKTDDKTESEAGEEVREKRRRTTKFKVGI